MLLTIDIGNSATKWAVFDATEIMLSGRADLPVLDKIDAVAIATVVPERVAPIAAEARRQYGRDALVAGHDFPVPIENRCDEPARVGVDRLLNALAAYERTAGACIVVDAGSAVTVDAVDASGAFLGGAIVAGPGLAAAALHDHTAQLPCMEPRVPESAIGRNTGAAIEAGLYHACRGAVAELVGAIAAEAGGVEHVLATGGFAPWLADLDCVTLVDEHLTLRGLRLAWAKRA